MWTLDRVSRVLFAGVLGAALLCAGCGVSTLKTMKKDHREGRFAKVAAVDLSCGPEDERCNQMHLLKGDACYVLGRRAEEADQDSTARARFECAETHLGAGIQQTDAAGWTVAGEDRTQWYTNRAESLRQLQDLQSGEAAHAASKRLLDFGRAFREVDPDAAAPYFYVATARYALIQPELIDAPPGDADVCKELNAIRTVLNEAPSGPGTSSDVQDNIESLRRQVNSQRSRLECAP